MFFCKQFCIFIPQLLSIQQEQYGDKRAIRTSDNASGPFGYPLRNNGFYFLALMMMINTSDHVSVRDAFLKFIENIFRVLASPHGSSAPRATCTDQFSLIYGQTIVKALYTVIIFFRFNFSPTSNVDPNVVCNHVFALPRELQVAQGQSKKRGKEAQIPRLIPV